LNKTTLSFASITFAQKARRILGGESIPSELIKIDTKRTSSGCTYGLQIDSKSYLNAIGLLRARGIPYSTVN
jgi:hypothetical protein